MYCEICGQVVESKEDCPLKEKPCLDRKEEEKGEDE